MLVDDAAAVQWQFTEPENATLTLPLPESTDTVSLLLNASNWKLA